MHQAFFNGNLAITQEVLAVMAYLPTASLAKLSTADFWPRLTDADFMRIAVLLAAKSYDEGGCPIGAVVVDNRSRRILGKGHNTLIQENHPYNHGETSAMRDAGSIDFSATSLFTTLTPCNVCATLLVERSVARVVIGNSPNSVNNQHWLSEHQVCVEVMVDEYGCELYARYQREKPAQDLVDWKGVAALKRSPGTTHQPLG